MASTDWTVATSGLGGGDCAKGVTAGTSKPTGGGTFIYGMNTLTNTPGAVALYTNQANFAPMAKGGDVRGAVCRGLSGGASGWSAFLFVALQNTSVNDNCYMLGLSNGDPAHIELRKGALSVGLPDETPGGVNKVLRQSTGTYSPETWTHLRLEAVVNLNGDVVLNCYQNLGSVTSPSWVAIAGMAQFIDDALGVNTGSAPYTSGRVGFGGVFADSARRAYFDHMEIARQL